MISKLNYSHCKKTYNFNFLKLILNQKARLKIVIFLTLILCYKIWYYVKIVSNINEYNNKHFFVFRSFFYPRSKAFGDETKSAVVILVNIDKSFDTTTLKPICEFLLNDGSRIRKKAEIKELQDTVTSSCRLWNYRFVCHSLKLSEDVINGKNIIFTPEFFLGIRGKKPVMLPITRADTTKRTLIICPGRMFAFDMWHLFLMTMELHRLHQVDLIIIYIQSVDARIYELIKEYSLEKWVEIRPNLRMPNNATRLIYNPNSETTWNNQIVNFLDCFYEFRESAEFIAFPDWDDLFFPPLEKNNYGAGVQPLGPILQKIALEEPKAASFVYQRTGGYLKKLDEIFTKNEDQANIVAKLQDVLVFSEYDSIGGGKVVLRPLLTDGVQIHLAGAMREGFYEYTIPWNKTFIIHARDHIERKLNQRLKNITILEKQLEKFIKRENIHNILKKLPKKEAMLNIFNNCLGVAGVDAWKNMVRRVKEGKRSRCYNYDQCQLKMPITDCINVQTTWKSVKVQSGELYFSYFKSANFELQKECIV